MQFLKKSKATEAQLAKAQLEMDKSLLKAQALARAGVLVAPASFKNATLEELRSVCNGCGASGSWFRPPATMWGTVIVYACHIHDWMYNFGKVIEDKEEADRTMRNNIQRLIRRDNKWWKPALLQMVRSQLYYVSVDWFGGDAFWKGKN